MNVPIDWLLEGEPWIEYRTRLDLLGQPEEEPLVQSARASILNHPQGFSLLQELSDWPGTVISSHKNASQSFHKLTFLADLGLKTGDPGVQTIIDKIYAHQSPEGPFQLLTKIPEHFGGSDKDEWAWSLCDAPLIVYALVHFGCGNDPNVRKATNHLVSLVRENGWPCVVSKELGNFHGPGRREDPCPFATLAMVKMLSAIPDLVESPSAHSGVETLLDLWNESAVKHPYIFYMGNDFRKLKVPFIWYDLIHVLDVISRFPWVTKDARFLDMRGVLQSKADPQGRFTPESVWTAWKDWEFGQKKAPSRWLSLLAWRIFRRAGVDSF